MRRLFSIWLRQLRQRRKVSQEQLADRAQIAVRTIRYWEAGQFSPRETELHTILQVLEVTLEERMEGLSLLTATWNLRRVGPAENKDDKGADVCDRMYGLGDLLTAMRTRCGWTQEQVADEAGVSRATIIRWETSKVLPSKENLARMCTLLRATPDESQALCNRRLTLPGWCGRLTLAECEEKQEQLYHLVVHENPPLLDLHALALKRQICILLPTHREATRLLARTEATHGGWLLAQNQGAASFQCCKQALDLARKATSADMFAAWALNGMGAYCALGLQNTSKAIDLMRHWLPLFSPVQQMYARCDMALYTAVAAPDAGLSLLREAWKLYNQAVEDEAVEKYFRVTSARIMQAAGDPHAALTLLPPLPSEINLSNINRWLVWTEILLQAGERTAASAHAQKIGNTGVRFLAQRGQDRYQTIVQQLQ